jgi:hypothetical protein
MKANRVVVAAFVFAVVGALLAAFAPLGTTCGVTVPGGVSHCSGTSTFSVDGAWVLVVVSVPVLVTLVPLLVRRRAAIIASTVLLWIGCILGMLSVGIFFLPSAILMTVAAARRDPDPLPPVAAA